LTAVKVFDTLKISCMKALKSRWRPLLRTVALGLVLGVLLTPVGMAHFDLTPDVCDTLSELPDGGEPRVSTASLPGDLHQHCYTCHWLQSFRSTLLVSNVPVLDAVASCPLPSLPAANCESVAVASVPARAPPAFPLSLSS